MVLYNSKRLGKLGIIAMLVMLFNRCDNSLNVTADWKEIPVIYGLLNPSASENYIRINRAYLNQEGDAISYGSVADSIYFEDLTVSLVETRNGVEGNTINFVKRDYVFVAITDSIVVMCLIGQYPIPEASWSAEVLQEAIWTHGKPKVINTYQESQFTSEIFT